MKWPKMNIKMWWSFFPFGFIISSHLVCWLVFIENAIVFRLKNRSFYIIRCMYITHEPETEKSTDHIRIWWCVMPYDWSVYLSFLRPWLLVCSLLRRKKTNCMIEWWALYIELLSIFFNSCTLPYLLAYILFHTHTL